MSQLEPMMAEENKNCTALPSLSLLLGSGCVFQDVCRIKTRGAYANSTRASKRGWVLRNRQRVHPVSNTSIPVGKKNNGLNRGHKKNYHQLKAMHNPTRKNRGRAMRVTLFCEWGRHCSTLAASPKHSTARCLSPPTNTTFVECSGGGNRLCSPWRRPSTALQIT